MGDSQAQQDGQALPRGVAPDAAAFRGRSGSSSRPEATVLKLVLLDVVVDPASDGVDLEASGLRNARISATCPILDGNTPRARLQEAERARRRLSSDHSSVLVGGEANMV
jgi:hypothetical protein